MSEPLTLAEAVPLGTAYLQPLLIRSGVRCLVIKGPAFVELGVRRPRQSNDVDLLIHPRDRTHVEFVLRSARWEVISHRLPAVLDDFAYSTTYRHPLFPVSVDVHHAFLGLLNWPDAFDKMWSRRGTTEIAHVESVVPSREDAMVIEALNTLKSKKPHSWPSAGMSIVERAEHFDVARLEEVASSLGASATIAPVITAMGGASVKEPTTYEYRRWMHEAGGDRRRMLLVHLIRRAPWAVPNFMLQQVGLSNERAQTWAAAHGVTFRSRRQIFLLRAKKLLKG